MIGIHRVKVMQEPGHENSVLIAFVTSEGFRELAQLHSLPRALLFTLLDLI